MTAVHNIRIMSLPHNDPIYRPYETINEFYDIYKQKQGVCGSINGVKAMELAHKYPDKKIRLLGFNFKKEDGSPLRHVLITYGNLVMDMSNMGYGGEPIIMSYRDFLARLHNKMGKYPYIVASEPVYLYAKNHIKHKIIANCFEGRYDTEQKYIINCGIDMGNTLLEKMIKTELVDDGSLWANSVEEYATGAEPYKLRELGINFWE
tara:strand:+ start:797 stop:1414 length:618 start_codon:yes stop_codon:yes gene_type:complete